MLSVAVHKTLLCGAQTPPPTKCPPASDSQTCCIAARCFPWTQRGPQMLRHSPCTYIHTCTLQHTGIVQCAEHPLNSDQPQNTWAPVQRRHPPQSNMAPPGLAELHHNLQTSLIKHRLGQQYWLILQGTQTCHNPGTDYSRHISMPFKIDALVNTQNSLTAHKITSPHIFPLEQRLATQFTWLAHGRKPCHTVQTFAPWFPNLI